MRKRQENKISMYIATKEVCDKHIDLINSLPAIKSTYSRFTENLSELQNKFKNQQIEIGGITNDKSDLTDELIEKSVEIGGIVHAYANSIGNNDLRTRANIRNSELNKLRDAALLEKCNQILGDAKAISNKLTDYGITEEILNDFSNKIDKYKQIIVAPRTAIVERKGVTEIIVDLIDEIDDILINEIDRFMNSFKSINQEFYLNYFAAREIIDLGLRKEKQLNTNPS